MDLANSVAVRVFHAWFKPPLPLAFNPQPLAPALTEPNGSVLALSLLWLHGDPGPDEE